MDALTLLYAENDVDTLQDTLFLLGEYFTSTYTAQDGKSALELYDKNRPDIVLLDINLPLMDGLECARKIRQTDEETPIVIVSAYSDRDKLLNAINIGVSAYVAKPFKIKEIQETIERLIEKKATKGEVLLGSDLKWSLQLKKLYYKTEQIPLTRSEISLMNILCQNRQKFFTPKELKEELFSDSKKDTDSNNVTQLISRFKKKILTTLDIDIFFIENIYGAGYRIRTINSN